MRRADRTVLLTGFTRARTSMIVSSEVSGICLSVNGDVGDEVADDGRFVVIDATFIKLDIENNKISQKQIESRIAYLQKDVNRYQLLYKKQSMAEAKLDTLQEELAQSEFQLQSLQNKEEVLLERLKRHTVFAPAGWKVINRYVEPGTLVTVGQALAEVADYQVLTVPLALTHTEYKQLLSYESPFPVYLPEEKKEIMAEIYRVSPAFDPGTRKINVELSLISPFVGQMGGVRVEVSLSIPENKSFFVPAAAVQKRYDEYWLTRESGESVSVIILENKGEFVRITSPAIQPGERFVLDPVEQHGDSK